MIHTTPSDKYWNFETSAIRLSVVPFQHYLYNIGILDTIIIVNLFSPQSHDQLLQL